MSARERYLLAAAAASPNLERGRRVRPVEEKHRQAARDVLRKGKPIGEALLALGYSPKQAAKGLALVKRSHALKTAFQEETSRVEKEMAEAPLLPKTWRAREELIVGRLEKNVRGWERWRSDVREVVGLAPRAELMDSRKSDWSHHSERAADARFD